MSKPIGKSWRFSTSTASSSTISGTPGVCTQRKWEKTIAGTIEVLERSKPLSREFFSIHSETGPAVGEEARARIAAWTASDAGEDRGMKLCSQPRGSDALEPRSGGVVQNTDPALVWMCLDLDWTWQAGTDPFPLLYEAGDKGRLGAIHMRTQHNKVTDQTMEDGGDIDFHKVADYLKKIQFDGALVEETEWMEETKVTRAPRENKRLARIWCEKVFGVPASA
jgi:sugar phosphate isomerase/epimerase